MKKFKKIPLFIVTGASGSGKSSACGVLFETQEKYIVIESDILWNEIYDKPEENYKEYRRVWLTLCARISRGEKPVVLCGCAVPEQFEPLKERSFFSKIYYLAIVRSDNVLKKRLTNGRKIKDASHIESSLSFNKVLRVFRKRFAGDRSLIRNVREKASFFKSFLPYPCHKSLTRLPKTFCRR